MQLDSNKLAVEQVNFSLTPELKEKLLMPSLRALEPHIEYESE